MSPPWSAFRQSKTTRDPQDPERGSFAYYEYNHGVGDHVLMRERDYSYPSSKPEYSLRCLACHCVDCLVLLSVFAFLGFSLYLAYYVLNNYGDGGG